jgi:uncharacterized protein YjiS (DUF1127 family)
MSFGRKPDHLIQGNSIMIALPHSPAETGTPRGFDAPRFLADLAGRAAAAMAAGRAKARARRDYARLRALDDHFLADMGITRSAITAAERGL